MTTLVRQIETDELHCRERRRLEISGTVQGVGFRPFLYRLAQAHRLSGFTFNTGSGVTVEVEGAAKSITAFVEEIRQMPPPNAVVGAVATSNLPPQGDDGFVIKESRPSHETLVSIPADLGTCKTCLSEIFDPENHRHLYPFTNCTNCGPRYSLIKTMPYDRDHTTMGDFAMCDTCRTEYEDPADRRYHAEPNACPNCGPQLTLLDTGGTPLAARHEALLAAAGALRDGAIVAIKGLGGFHLATDARREDAVGRLRARKARAEKPFAVMFPSREAAHAACVLSPGEDRLLTGRERPIVLLRRRTGESTICEAVAPGSPYLGAMLPYTPLHHILMRELGFPLVMTSGNRSDEPIAIDTEEALTRLGAIADLFLVHDRAIARPVDDSVARIIRGRPMLLRRARGYAPASVPSKNVAPGILALGGNMKSTVALTGTGGFALSQHLGDLDSPEARDNYDGAVKDLVTLREAPIRAVACDLHPDYYSTRKAEAWPAPAVLVQHHLAHVGAVIAEQGLSPPLLGVAWDGTGYGTDGTIWGGEFLHIVETGWRRVAHLRPFRLPGAAAAIRDPRRVAFSLLYEMFGERMEAWNDLPPIAAFTAGERHILRHMLERKVNAPVATSAGRLFDAVAALLGLCQRSTYDGQAAMALEWACPDEPAGTPYAFPVTGGVTQRGPWVIDWEPALRQILHDIATGRSAADISSAFHLGLATAILSVAEKLEEPEIVLSGGCFQNRVLAESSISLLTKHGFNPAWPCRVPAGDGGLALGQAWWAARQIEAEKIPCA